MYINPPGQDAHGARGARCIRRELGGVGRWGAYAKLLFTKNLTSLPLDVYVATA